MPIELAEDGEKFSGVDTLLSRMKTHPEEFFEAGEKRGRWSFIYKDYFKDFLTESEKGRILEALRVVRRLEFDALVVKELMREERQEQMYEQANMTMTNVRGSGGTVTVGPSPFGAVPQGRE
jgi:hypothetical protein